MRTLRKQPFTAAAWDEAAALFPHAREFEMSGRRRTLPQTRDAPRSARRNCIRTVNVALSAWNAIRPPWLRTGRAEPNDRWPRRASARALASPPRSSELHIPRDSAVLTAMGSFRQNRVLALGSCETPRLSDALATAISGAIPVFRRFL